MAPFVHNGVDISETYVYLISLFASVLPAPLLKDLEMTGSGAASSWSASVSVKRWLVSKTHPSRWECKTRDFNAGLCAEPLYYLCLLMENVSHSYKSYAHCAAHSCLQNSHSRVCASNSSALWWHTPKIKNIYAIAAYLNIYIRIYELIYIYIQIYIFFFSCTSIYLINDSPLLL